MNIIGRHAVMQEFWKTVVEVDQAWLDYQEHATDEFWENWKKLKEDEAQLMEVLGIDRNGISRLRPQETP